MPNQNKDNESPYPVDGMTVIPYGISYMGEAWAGCVSFAISKPEIREQFKAETGYDLDSLVKASPMDRMIDEAAGLKRKMYVAWCDWVTVNMWGVEGQDDPEEKENS